MGTKNQSMATKKKQRAVARKAKGSNSKAKLTGTKLVKEIAQHGVRGTVERHYSTLAKSIREDKTVPTNAETYQTLFKIIGDVAPIHSIMEVLTILEQEHQIEFAPGVPELLDLSDELVVKIAEDTTAIRILLEEGQSFDDFAEVFISLIDNTTTLLTTHAKQLYDEAMIPNQVLAEEYIKEHCEPNESRIEFAFRMHEQRMARVQDKYRTVITEVPEPPADAIEELQEFIPADEVCGEDLGSLIKNVN